MSERIAIVSPKQPGTNPRMKKAADALSKHGHRVHVLYAFTADWADSADQLTFQNAQWSHQLIGGHPTTDVWTYFKTRIRRKWSATVGDEIGALMPNTKSYIKALKDFQPGLVIGHNPGALPILQQWKRSIGGKVLFDAEDFHRAEAYVARTNKREFIKHLEDWALPEVNGITAASPLIAKAYSQLYPDTTVVPVNNGFSKDLLQKEPSVLNGPLKIVWFSQVLGLDRGLSDFMRGMALVPAIPIELSLIGNSTEEKEDSFQLEIHSSNHSIQFIKPEPEERLFKLLATNEIGLVLESTKPFSRDICRANKLYSYPLAGCYTIMSKTAGQMGFLNEWPSAGQCVERTQPESIAQALDHAFHHREELLAKRKETWSLAKSQLNWEAECKPLLDLVNQTLKS